MTLKGIVLFASILSTALISRAWGAIQAPLEDQLRLLEQGKTPERLIAGATHRVAVFTFEDADDTGLGDVVAALAAREVLTNSRVSSIGVIFFSGGLAPTADSGLSYFDKVEKVTAAQEVTLAIWGIIRTTTSGIQIDTYLQIPEPSLDKYFTWKLRLPRAMKGGELTARLRPDRVLVQRRVFSADGVGHLRDAAAEIGRLRASPRADAEVVAELPLSEVYYLTDRRPGWVRLRTRRTGGVDGWAPTKGHCPGECKAFLGAATFSGRVLRYMADGSLPSSDEGLGLESQALVHQLQILNALDSTSPDDLHQAAEQANLWQEKDTIPPGGAAFANLEAMAALGIGLKEVFVELAMGEFGVDAQGSEPIPDSVQTEIYDSIRLTPRYVAEIARSLAHASQYDPRNTDVLGNLAVLFDYLGDTERARLAQRLVTQYAR